MTDTLHKLVLLLGPNLLLYGGGAVLGLIFLLTIALTWRKRRKAAQALNRLAAKSKEAGLLAFGDDNESEHSKALTAKPIHDRGHTSATRANSDRETQILASSQESTSQYSQFFRQVTDALQEKDLKSLRKWLTDALYSEAVILCQLPAASAKKFSEVHCTIQSADGDRVSVSFRARALNAGYVEQVWYLQKSSLTKSLKLERIV